MVVPQFLPGAWVKGGKIPIGLADEYEAARGGQSTSCPKACLPCPPNFPVRSWIPRLEPGPLPEGIVAHLRRSTISADYVGVAGPHFHSIRLVGIWIYASRIENLLCIHSWYVYQASLGVERH